MTAKAPHPSTCTTATATSCTAARPSESTATVGAIVPKPRVPANTTLNTAATGTKQERIFS